MRLARFYKAFSPDHAREMFECMMDIFELKGHEVIRPSSNSFRLKCSNGFVEFILTHDGVREYWIPFGN